MNTLRIAAFFSVVDCGCLSLLAIVQLDLFFLPLFRSQRLS